MDIAIEILQKQLIEAQGALKEAEMLSQKECQNYIDIITNLVDNSTVLLVDCLQHLEPGILADDIIKYIDSLRNLENELNKINKIR
jgi:hypothetical protein